MAATQVAAALIPDARFRSSTAMPGQSDMRDENVYSAIVLQNTGVGPQTIFTAPIGQSIPTIGGSTAPLQTWQTKYSLGTTNITKAGELGNALGDASVRAIGMMLEPAAYVPNTGAARAYGATQFELADITSKLAFEFKIGGKRQNSGGFHMYPTYGGPMGGISTTGNATTVAIANNGAPGSLRRLKFPILVARVDQLEAIFSTNNGSSLAFNTVSAASDGQPVLLWVNLHSSLAGDVR
jgi:hypothetical protein